MTKIVLCALALVVGLSNFAFAGDVATQSEAGANAGAASQSGAQSALIINSHSVAEAPDIPAASSAAVLIQSCQEGVSGQGFEGGLAAGFDSAQCVNIRQASIHLQMYERYYATKQYDAAQRHLAKFHTYLDRADVSADWAYPTKVAGGTVTALLPIALLFVIF